MDPGKFWTPEEVRKFEVAMVAYIEGNQISVPWEKVAAYVPGRTVDEVKAHYDELVEDICWNFPYALSLPICDLPEESDAGCSDGNLGSVIEPMSDQEEIESTAERNPGQSINTSDGSCSEVINPSDDDDEEGQ